MDQTGSGVRSRGAAPFRFDTIVVDPAAHSLLRAGVSQPLEPKAFAVLLVLLQHSGELVGRDDLLDQVWGHRHVTPGVLTRAIAQLRHALDDDSQQPRYIQTHHALGYSFIGHLGGEEGVPVQAGGDDQPESAITDLPLAVDDSAMPARLDPSDPAPERAPEQEHAGADVVLPVVDPRPARRRRRWLALAAWLLLISLAAAWFLWNRIPVSPRPIAASIAVMPFTSLSSQRSDDYFAEGLAEEMRDALAGVKGLRVAAFSASSTGTGYSDVKALGARLGVATVLDASVRREGSRVRITAHLSDTSTGFTLWSHTYDRELSDVFATQSEIANEVVHALLGVMPGESNLLAKRLTPTHNAAAFDVYLQGLQMLHQTSRPDSTDKAIERFGQALKEDSGFARAQAGICRAEIWRFESKHSAEAFKNAQLACQRAVEMDPALAEVDLALGDLYRASGDSGRALQHYRSSARSPALQIRAHIGEAQVYAAMGRHDLAYAQFQQALQLGPDDPALLAQIGYQQYLDGDVTHAVASYRQAVGLQPGDANLWGTLGALYMELGDNAAAVQALQHSIGIAPAAATLTNLGSLRYQAGDYAAAVDLQRQATALDPQDFMTWGNLGEALHADSAASPADVHKAYEQAAVRAESYLRVKPDDARAVASLGLYRIMLGDASSARKLVKRAESLSGQPGEVALLNAETLALLGDVGAARERLASARAAGMAETLIASNLVFRRLGLLSPVKAAERGSGTESPVPGASKGHPPGG
ncbi:TolB-like protein/DNA-binding winged helix-turn-helix (wHTH) protein/Flp pilus assembly protein TadD [Rhodanobacter sp. TND4EL1]